MQTRRNFAGLAAAFSAGEFLNLNPLARGANEKIGLALIGGHNQGNGVALRAIEQGADIKTICDIDDAVSAKFAATAEAKQKRKPGTVRDFRRVLDDKSIDGIIIATPDHWHTHMALLACQAGKDVYLEKPVSQTIREGQMIRDAALKYKRVVQVGIHRRSAEHNRSAMEFLATGKLGKICLIRAWMCQVRKSIGNPPDGTPPAGVDYDAWLGPAPKRHFNPNRFHYNWRFFWDYGNSELGNQGVHKLDLVAWGLATLRGTENVLPRRITSTAGIYWLKDAKEVPDTQMVTYDYGDLMVLYELQSFQNYRPVEGIRAGVAFYGTEATLLLDNDSWKVVAAKGQVVNEVKATGGSHEGNFLACMKHRKRPNCDIETGRISTTFCHLGNISHHLGAGIQFDPKTETFPGNARANAMLTKEYRKEYALPKL